VTASASGVSSTGATLNGTANPHGTSTSYYFQYCTSTAYGGTTASTSAGSGTGNVAAAKAVTGLSPSTTYHYRVVAVSNAGRSFGLDATFTTAP
jgi:hypothetical protein